MDPRIESSSNLAVNNESGVPQLDASSADIERYLRFVLSSIQQGKLQAAEEFCWALQGAGLRHPLIELCYATTKSLMGDASFFAKLLSDPARRDWFEHNDTAKNALAASLALADRFLNQSVEPEMKEP